MTSLYFAAEEIIMTEIKKIATRDAYGKALAELAKENSNIFVMDADLSQSTKSVEFAKVCPERFVNAGIAEGNICLLYTSRCV